MNYTESKKLHDSMVSANRGYWDGKAAANVKIRGHLEWPEGKHFDSAYEHGYWTGYRGHGIPYHAEDFAIFDRMDEEDGH